VTTTINAEHADLAEFALEPLVPRVLRISARSAFDFVNLRRVILMSHGEKETGGGVKERQRSETKQQEPTIFHVVLLNDDYTPMMFVVDVLEDVFQKSPADAFRIMMQVHLNGRGVAGSYAWEIAETKADKVASLAHEAGYPLKATIEEA
jgi:ATP-dependent Clp protease adaptor protein ClpS